MGLFLHNPGLPLSGGTMFGDVTFDTNARNTRIASNGTPRAAISINAGSFQLYAMESHMSASMRSITYDMDGVEISASRATDADRLDEPLLRPRIHSGVLSAHDARLLLRLADVDVRDLHVVVGVSALLVAAVGGQQEHQSHHHEQRHD